MIDHRKLADAAALVEHAIRHADTAVEPCEHCGFEKRRNWTETQGAKELGSVVKKLRTWAHRVERQEKSEDKGDGRLPSQDGVA